MIKFITDRLKERSTWLGLTALVSVFGITLAPEQVEAIVSAGVALAAAIAIFTKE